MAVDDKNPVLNRDNLTIPIQMQLSHKNKNFFSFFAPFLKSSRNLECWENKDDPHSFCIFENTDSENVVREMPKKSCFWRLFDKQHGKRAKALLKSASEHLYLIHSSLARKLSWKKSLFLTLEILGYLLTHWLPRTIILFLIEII